MEKNQSIKYNLYFVIIALILVLGAYLFLVSLIRGKQGDELNVAMARLREVESIQDNFSIYDNLLRDTREERSSLDSFVVEKKTTAEFITGLEKLAKHSNVEITKTISVEKNPQKTKETMLKVNIKAKGKLEDVYYFAFLVENMPYKIRIKTLALGTSDASRLTLPNAVLAVTDSKTKNVAKEETWSGNVDFDLLGYINE